MTELSHLVQFIDKLVILKLPIVKECGSKQHPSVTVNPGCMSHHAQSPFNQ